MYKRCCRCQCLLSAQPEVWIQRLMDRMKVPAAIPASFPLQCIRSPTGVGRVIAEKWLSDFSEVLKSKQSWIANAGCGCSEDHGGGSRNRRGERSKDKAFRLAAAKAQKFVFQFPAGIWGCRRATESTHKCTFAEGKL